jgi:hypothetical protein
MKLLDAKFCWFPQNPLEKEGSREEREFPQKPQQAEQAGYRICLESFSPRSTHPCVTALPACPVHGRGVGEGREENRGKRESR